jgi:hypothetical protein
MISDLYKWCIYLSCCRSTRPPDEYLASISIKLDDQHQERNINLWIQLRVCTSLIHFSGLFIFLSTVAGEWRDFVVLWVAAFFYFIPFRGDIEASTRGFIEQKRVL